MTRPQLPQLTAPQLRQLQRMVTAHPEAVTARDHGERVTLASLHGRGMATRAARARQGRANVPQRDAGAPDQAWAYTITTAGCAALTAWLRAAS
jgi:hypothetical protein